MFGEYISSGQGTVDTLHLQDGGTVQVSAVDGDSPYIVARSNPHCHCAHGADKRNARSNGTKDELQIYAFAIGAPLVAGGLSFLLFRALGRTMT